MRWSFIVDDVPAFISVPVMQWRQICRLHLTRGHRVDLTFKYVHTQAPLHPEGIEMLIEVESESHSDSSASREHKFDGPGGALAKVELVGAVHHIAFDEDEKWLLMEQAAAPESEQAGIDSCYQSRFMRSATCLVWITRRASTCRGTVLRCRPHMQWAQMM